VRYSQSPAQSAELLRLVLPRIAKHGGHYAPTTYAVWYEYVGGLNKALNEDLDARLQGNGALDQPDIETIYERHVAERESRSAVALQDGLGELLRKLADAAATSGEGTAGYARALSECERELGTVGDAESLQRVIKTLISSTTVVRDTTERVQAELEASRTEMLQLRESLGALRTEALSDPLTGLHNRRGFERTLAELYAADSGGLQSAGLLLADIDHFKKVNDTYGHLVGDQVIRATAQVLKSAVKGRDIVARFGGEEFIILLPDTPAHGALALAEQVRNEFSKLRIRRNGSDDAIAQITLSIGVAVPIAGENVEQAINRADKALYKAKNAGRNRVCFAEEAAAT
jgi:diguanylate cyclase